MITTTNTIRYPIMPYHEMTFLADNHYHYHINTITNVRGITNTNTINNTDTIPLSICQQRHLQGRVGELVRKVQSEVNRK